MVGGQRCDRPERNHRRTNSRVTARTTASNVTVFGDTTFEQEPLDHFQIQSNEAVRTENDTPAPNVPQGIVDSRFVRIHLTYYAWLRANPAEKEAKKEAFQAELAAEDAIERQFSQLAWEVCQDADCVTRVKDTSD